MCGTARWEMALKKIEITKQKNGPSDRDRYDQLHYNVPGMQAHDFPGSELTLPH